MPPATRGTSPGLQAALSAIHKTREVRDQPHVAPQKTKGLPEMHPAVVRIWLLAQAKPKRFEWIFSE